MKKKDVSFIITIFVILFLLVLVVYNVYMLLDLSNEKEAKKRKKGLIKIEKHVKGDTTAKLERQREVKDSVDKDDKSTFAAIIIDDLGRDYNIVNDFMSLGPDFTFSVLPYEKHSKQIAKIVSEKGYEVMLHLPMEPYDYPEKNDPGKGALLISTKRDEIAKGVNEMIGSLSGVAGVNNHMGSRFCEDYERMSEVMNVIKEKGLFFVDSKTSELSCIKEISNIYDIPLESRDVFLDNDKEEESILKQIDRVINISKKYGFSVAICHPYEETFSTLEKAIDKFQENGVVIKRVSEIIKLQSVKKIKKKSNSIPK